MECLTDIIGVTQSDCPCLINGLTEDQITELAKSQSGFYMDDIPDAVTLKAIKLVDACQGFYEMATYSKKQAIISLQDDIAAGLELKFKQAKGNYFGSIGRTQYAGTLPATKPIYFMKIEPNGKTDAAITFKKARIYSSEAGNTNFYIFKMVNGDLEQVFTAPVSLIANNATLVTPAANLVLPMDQNGQPVTYFVAWETINGAKPKDNKVDCNCNAGNGAGFGDYVTVSGGEAAVLIDMDTAKTVNKAYGIVLDVEIRCISSNFVCREYNDKNALAIVAKWAVAYKANEILIERILSSPEVNRYTLMNREHLYGKRNHFRAEYQNRVQYILDNVDVSKTDCFICKQSGLFLGGILT